MSKHETHLTRRYWQETGGSLIEEFLAVHGGPNQGKRLLDGVIIVDGEKKIAQNGEIDIDGKDIIIIQTKAKRLGMYRMGQAVFSIKLMEAFHPASIRSVAICTQHDSILEPLLAPYGVEVIVYED